jgi:hypothetical protein
MDGRADSDLQRQGLNWSNLKRLKERHGVGLEEIVAAAVATRATAWLADDHDEVFRQDLLIGRDMQEIETPSNTVVIPDEVIRDVATKLFVEGGEQAAVSTLLNWWNTVSPLDLPVATDFDIFGQYQAHGYSYLVDSPDGRAPESFEAKIGSAKSTGLYVEFRFHRTREGNITIYNMDGSAIEGCVCNYDQYVWWMAMSLRRAFELEWKVFVPKAG